MLIQVLLIAQIFILSGFYYLNHYYLNQDEFQTLLLKGENIFCNFKTYNKEEQTNKPLLCKEFSLCGVNSKGMPSQIPRNIFLLTKDIE